jgi:hypothetical protein
MNQRFKHGDAHKYLGKNDSNTEKSAKATFQPREKPGPRLTSALNSFLANTLRQRSVNNPQGREAV